MMFFAIIGLMNTFFIGHSNDSTLIAGVGMGNMLINVFAFAVMQGLNGALESLVSVSYGASEVPGIGKKEKDF
jgi:Na+-driven multidrug efflux pump